jgi:methylmalonyl-CoA/ethylmalonyl-CoA epimerase
MEEIEKGQLPFSQLHHICMVVRDLEKAKKFYEALGIGPFKPLPPAPEKPAEITYIETFAKMGSIGLQLLQPSAKGDKVFKNIFRRFLDKHGEGMHHICFIANDIKKDVDDLVKKGHELIDTHYLTTGGGEAFLTFDPNGDTAGFCLQLLDKRRGAELDKDMRSK